MSSSILALEMASQLSFYDLTENENKGGGF